MKLPMGGAECGYCFDLCTSFCSSVVAGPYCRIGFGFTSRDGCDGGLNLSGLAMTFGDFDFEVDAWREDEDVRHW